MNALPTCRSRRPMLERRRDAQLSLVLGLLVVSRHGSATEIEGYLLTLATRALDGARMGDA